MLKRNNKHPHLYSQVACKVVDHDPQLKQRAEIKLIDQPYGWSYE